jgi:Recombination endonuclease VII
VKELNQFHVLGSGRKEDQRSYYADSKNRLNTNRRERERSNPGRKFGFSKTEWDAILVTQNGQCALGHPLVGRPHADHDHQTGRFRGILCKKCNVALGMMDDDPARLVAAAKYLGWLA